MVWGGESARVRACEELCSHASFQHSRHSHADEIAPIAATAAVTRCLRLLMMKSKTVKIVRMTPTPMLLRWTPSWTSSRRTTGIRPWTIFWSRRTRAKFKFLPQHSTDNAAHIEVFHGRTIRTRHPIDSTGQSYIAMRWIPRTPSVFDEQKKIPTFTD